MHKQANFDRVFGALADPARRAIVAELSRGERSATDLVGVVPRRVSQPAVSRHLRVLREAGLIEKHVHGRMHWCRLRGEALGEAAAWLEQYRGFWEDRLGALAELFGDPPGPPHTGSDSRAGSVGARGNRTHRKDKR